MQDVLDTKAATANLVGGIYSIVLRSVDRVTARIDWAHADHKPIADLYHDCLVDIIAQLNSEKDKPY